MTTNDAKLFAIKADELQKEFLDLTKSLAEINEKQQQLYRAIANNRNKRRSMLENNIIPIDEGTKSKLSKLSDAISLTVVNKQQQEQKQQQQQQKILSGVTTTTVPTEPVTGLVIRSETGDLYAIPSQPGLNMTMCSKIDPSCGLQQVNAQQATGNIVYLLNNNNNQNITNFTQVKKNTFRNNKPKFEKNPVHHTKPPMNKIINICPTEKGSNMYRIVTKTNTTPTTTSNLKIVEVYGTIRPETTLTQKSFNDYNEDDSDIEILEESITLSRKSSTENSIGL